MAAVGDPPLFTQFMTLALLCLMIWMINIAGPDRAEMQIGVFGEKEMAMGSVDSVGRSMDVLAAFSDRSPAVLRRQQGEQIDSPGIRNAVLHDCGMQL